MIVGVVITDNRENVIGDAVKSFAAQVDRILIVDTGVTDGSLEKARKAAGKTPLEIVRHQWHDFAVARNFGLAAAEACDAKWVLFVDTDERVDFGSVVLRKALRAIEGSPVDVLLFESDDGFYPKEKIVRAKCGAAYFGPTHEALLGGGTRTTLRGVRFRELPKTEEQLRAKFERDVEILTKFSAENPGDPRWAYYLGVSFEGLQQREKAAAQFGKCAVLRRTGYEAAWARFKQADQLYLLGRYDESITAAALGLAINPTFGECAWIASVSALKLNRLKDAVAWARMAEAVGLYKGCGGERPWFRYLPALYELPYAVLCEALPDEFNRDKADQDFEKAKIARITAIDGLKNHDLEWMSVSSTIPPSNREEARTMLRPKPLAQICPSAKAVKIQFEPPDGRLPMNPSICRFKGELVCIIRAVNYSMRGRSYTVHDAQKIVRSSNYFGKLGLNGAFTQWSAIQDFDNGEKFPSRIVGYEDIRIVSVQGRSGETLVGSATVCDRDEEGRRQIAKLELDTRNNGLAIKKADVQKTNQVNEKNWMPLSVNGTFKWIYSLDPTAILPGPLNESPLRLEHLRGGAAVPVKDGYLCVTHEVIDDLPESRIYLHRFVKLDAKFNVKAVSGTWVFGHYGIEFCAGMSVHRGELLLSYGVADKQAWLMRVSAREVEEKMRWITP